MTKMIGKAFIAVFLLMGASLYAERFLLEYLEGTLETRQGERWIEADIGAVFSEKTMVRVGPDTFAELSYQRSRLVLSEPGIYSLEDILKRVNKVSSWKVAGLVGDKMKGLIAGGRAETGSAVMGVRGSVAKPSGEVEWAVEEEQALKDGRNLLAEKRYGEAAEHFLKAVKTADPEQRDTLVFFAGLSYSLMGKEALALRTLSAVTEDPQWKYFPVWAMLHGQLLLESGSFQKALALFNAYLKENPQGDQAQNAYLLSGYCLEELNSPAAALERFAKARDLDPASPAGKAANDKIQALPAKQ